MKVQKSKKCSYCRGYGKVGDPLGAMTSCNNCKGGRVYYWEEEPVYDPDPEPSSKKDFNGWWFIIGAIISSIFVLPMDQLSAMYKGGAILFCGGIVGAWWKQIFGLIICAVILFCAWVYIATKV